jgi:two-component system, cell cycle response regulator DivK
MPDESLKEPTGKVLYIEDQELNVLLVEAMLSRMPGLTLLKAGNGREGVRLAREQHPDLVILDMHLPDFGGLEVVRALTLEISDGLKIALLTGDQLSMDILKAMSLGAYEYWIKPLDPVQFDRNIRRALTTSGAEMRRRLAQSQAAR